MTPDHPDARLLRALRAPGGASDSTDLPNRLQALRAVGYEITETSPGRFTIIKEPSHLVADDIAAGLPEETVIGREIVVFRETDSTNDVAARAGADGAPEGIAIFAESQRAGRGRLGRVWRSAPEAGLWFSVLLRPSAPLDRWPELTFCAALAVAETSQEFTGVPARVKWPNDVLLDGKKVAGILLESHQRSAPGFVVIGIGLNVLHKAEDFDPELSDKATSLTLAAGRAINRRLVAVRLLSELNRLYTHWPDNAGRIMGDCLSRAARID